jgi:hypothetical protein
MGESGVGVHKTIRLILWRAAAWAIGFAILIPFYIGVDALMPDGILKTAVQWTVGAIVVTLLLGLRPADDAPSRARRPPVK